MGKSLHNLQSFKMTFAWKASGLTYNKYLSVAARVVRRSLKDDKRLQAERRGEMELKFAKWNNGSKARARALQRRMLLRWQRLAPSRRFPNGILILWKLGDEWHGWKRSGFEGRRDID